MRLPGCQVSVDEPPLLQVGHAAGHLHRVLAQGVDQHGALRTQAPEPLQQGAQRSQLRHLGGGGEKTDGSKYRQLLQSVVG